FNPSTTIQYALPHDVHATVRVVNMLGQVIVTLVDEQQQSGVHSVHFDGSQLASGVYLIQIFAGSDFGMRKMLLLK
ncbi:MAG TPA: peptidase S8, partial [Bacteroidetes bacterium]|nr:peptidase S8 [Bacteroidota bacterium]